MPEKETRRPRYLFTRPLPIAFGLLSGLGAAILLQQFAVAPLTLPFLLAMLAAGLVLIGIAVPTILYAFRSPEPDPEHPPSRARPRIATISIVALLVLAALVLVAVTVGAQTEGPCTTRINGEETDERVTLREDGTIAWSMTSHAGNISSWEVFLEYAGIPIPLSVGDDDPPEEQSKSDVADVDDYPDYGVGVYRVTGTAVLEDGETCTGTTDVVVPGNPFATILGWAGTVFMLGGVVGATVSANTAVNRDLERR